MTDSASESAARAPLGRRAELDLTPHRGAPKEAREFLAACCRDWQAGRYLDVGGLVLSELVTNAVRHANTEFSVLVCLADGVLTLGVRDRDTRPPYVVPRQDRSVGGQGMAIVAGLVSQWGVRHEDGGKLVWCRIPDPARERVPGPAAPASQTVCPVDSQLPHPSQGVSG